MRACERADAILFGAMGLPQECCLDGTEIVLQLELRVRFNLYAGMRPVRNPSSCPLTNARAAAVDLVLMREQTEGLFYARGRADVHGDDEIPDTMRIPLGLRAHLRLRRWPGRAPAALESAGASHLRG